MSSHEVKPQSIVHHIGRLGSKLNPMSKKRKRLQMQRKLAGSLTEFSVRSVTMNESSTSSVSFFDYSMTFDENSLGDLHTLEDSEITCSFLDDMFEEEDEEEQCLFESLDQNELLSECFLTNQQSDVIFFVHFSNEESSISNDIEDVLSTQILESQSSKCSECRRIDSKLAPLITAKLQTDPEQSTVVAIKNGKVLSMISCVSSSSEECCTEVKQWLMGTRILQNKKSSDCCFSGVWTYMHIDHSGRVSLG